MPLTSEQIITPTIDDGSSVERIRHRRVPLKMAIVESNPEWPARFEAIKTRISNAIGATALSINHAGSTSVPDLPAKDVIDVDLVVRDIKDEAAYVAQLESAGFSFLFREPAWHEHRFFVDEGDRPGAYPVNLHVFGIDCPEVERHRIFREWLLRNPEDVSLYAGVKRDSAKASLEAGENMMQYTDRKDKVVKEILERAFRDLGYIK